MYVVEFFYTKDNGKDVILKDEFVFNEQHVAYRNPYANPRKRFVLNQKTFDGFIRVLLRECPYTKDEKTTTLAAEYIRFGTLFRYAELYVNKKEITIPVERFCKLHLSCDNFGKTIVIFKVELEILKDPSL